MTAFQVGMIVRPYKQHGHRDTFGVIRSLELDQYQRIPVQLNPVTISRYEPYQLEVPPGTVTRDRQYRTALSVISNEILRTEVGSGVHGMAIEGTDDLDLMSIYIENRDSVYGLAEQVPHFVWRTQPEGHRSWPDDIDWTAYSLRKYVRMLLNGHPTAMLPLYAPIDGRTFVSHLGAELREHRESFLSRQNILRFLGYMRQQHSRMLGFTSHNVPKRPELIERYGWDCKYGAHALRLALQGHEVASTGHLTLPMAKTHTDLLRSIKLGEVDQDQVHLMISDLESGLLRILSGDDPSPLPEYPDSEFIGRWMVHAHERHWASQTGVDSVGQ